MKIIWRILLVIWFCAWTAVGVIMYSETPKQIEKDKKFKAQRIDPIVDATKDFIKSNNRIPTEVEFSRMTVNNDKELITEYEYLPDELKSKIRLTDWGNDTYAIAIWRGEWFEGYISNNDTYVLNDYSIADGILGLIYSIVFGLLPTFLTIVVSKLK